METRIKITPEESDHVEQLFMKFTGYCNILGYLAKDGSLDTNIFDKKWEEAVVINYALERAKEEVNAKYQPKDVGFTGFSFDFKTHELVYT